MSMSVGASASGVLSYLQQLLQQGTAGASGAANAPDPLSVLLQSISGSSDSAGQTSSGTPSASGAGSSGCAPFGADTMAALISLQGQSANALTAQLSSDLFAKLDTDGDGQISKADFETALGGAGVSSATADAIFTKLDANGDGSVSQSELASAKHGHGHHHHHAEGGGESQGSKPSGRSPLDALLSSAGADGATTKTATNADGSSTTTISYADGTTIEMTTPASSTTIASSSSGTSNSTSNQSNANLLEQLIQLQSQMLTAATSTLSAIV